MPFYVTKTAIKVPKDNILRMTTVGPHMSKLHAIWAEINGVPVINVPERNLPKRAIKARAGNRPRAAQDATPGACLVPGCPHKRYVIEDKKGSSVRRTMKSMLCEAHTTAMKDHKAFTTGSVLTELCRYLEPWVAYKDMYYLVFEANPASIPAMTQTMKVEFVEMKNPDLPAFPGNEDREWCECVFYDAKNKTGGGNGDDIIGFGPPEEVIMWWFLTNYKPAKNEDDLVAAMTDITSQFTNLQVVDSDEDTDPSEDEFD